MTKPWVRRRQRTSFGGKNGVWFPANVRKSRDNSNETTAKGEAENEEEQQQLAASTKQRRQSASPQLIGWDDDLCRPIYSVVPQDEASRDDDDDDDDSVLSGDAPIIKEVVVEGTKKENATNAPMVPAKRKATYGDRPRRRLSMILLDAGLGPICLPSEEDIKAKTSKKVKTDHHVDLGLSPDTPMALNTCGSPAFPYSPRRVSLDLEEEGSDHAPDSSGIQVSGSTFPMTRTTTSKTVVGAVTSAHGKVSSDEDDGLELDDASPPKQDLAAAAAPKTKRGKRKKKAKNDLPTPLLKAKEYFADLDKTHKLTICNDDDDDIQVSSQVIRTGYKPNLSSPRLQKEYKDYSEATRGMGVSPLPIREYVRGRRDFFRKGEFFDGFFDD